MLSTWGTYTRSRQAINSQAEWPNPQETAEMAGDIYICNPDFEALKHDLFPAPTGI